MKKFGIFVNGVQHGGSYAKAKRALATALGIWQRDLALRPEVVVRRIDGGRAVHRLPSGTYARVGEAWRRVSK